MKSDVAVSVASDRPDDRFHAIDRRSSARPLVSGSTVGQRWRLSGSALTHWFSRTVSTSVLECLVAKVAPGRETQDAGRP